MAFIPSTNLAHQIALHLSERIIHAEFKPGERIIEDKLARELGVSRSPLREAMRMLEKDGLVELMPRHGVRVTAMTKAHIACLYDILTELYALLIKKMSENISDAMVQKMETALIDLLTCATEQNVEGYCNAIFQFGAVALDTVKMPLLERMIMELWPSKRRVEYPITTLRQDKLMENAQLFLKTAEYARVGQIDKAIEAIREYIQGEKDFALAHISLE